MHSVADRIQIRRDTAANWAAANPILAQGELGYDINSSGIKIGNGATAWNSLPYLVGDVQSVTATSPITSSGGTSPNIALTTVPINLGGTGQTTKAPAFNALSPITATGDLIVGNGVNSATNLPIGANAKILTSDGTTASWQTNAGITALTGDVVATGPGSVTSTIQPNVVTNSKLAQMPANTIKGNNTGGTANAADLTVTQTRSMLGVGFGFSFITAGTTYTTPSTITTSTLFKFHLIGGGGGGGGIATANGHGCGGGGGGAGLLLITGLTPSTAYTVAIGAGGAGGAITPTAGGAGGNTTLTISATTYTAGGGGGGPATVSTIVGGAGGTAAGFTINVPGQNGEGTGSASAAGKGSNGGNSGFGFGLGGVGSVNVFGNDGFPGTGFGGGGGGAGISNGSAGGGSQGCIFVEFYG